MGKDNGRNGVGSEPPVGFYKPEKKGDQTQMMLRVTPDRAVEIRFSSSITWLKLKPETARMLAKLLVEYANRAEYV